MKHREPPTTWRGLPEAMLPLTEADWLDLLRKNRTELEAEERKKVIPTPDKDAA